MPEKERDLVRAWFEAAQRPVIDRAIRAVYEDIRRAIDEREPRCIASGRCCHFEKFDHRLFVTGLEAAWCLARVGRRLSTEDVASAREGGDCPFLIDERCSVHLVKPFGCRVYFCDESAQDWMHEIAARAHARIAKLHETHEVEYRYDEWRAMLRRFAQESERDATIWPLVDEVVPNHTDEPGRFVPLRVVDA